MAFLLNSGVCGNHVDVDPALPDLASLFGGRSDEVASVLVLCPLDSIIEGLIASILSLPMGLARGKIEEQST